MFASRFSRRRVQIDFGTEEVTIQSAKAECDINNILSQYKKTGIITHVQKAQATYQDLPDGVDFQEALHVLHAGEQAFAALPSVVRDYFANDPGRYLAAFSDPAQRAKLEEFGFVTPKPAATTPPPDEP